MALFLNQPAASVVAKLLNGENTTRVTGEIFDIYHKNLINNKRFVIFLNEHLQTSTIMQHRQLPLLHNNLDLLPLLSNGCDLWADVPISQRLQQLRDIYLQHYSAMSSNT